MTTKVFIDNCYYIPGEMLSEGKLVPQDQIFTAMHAGTGKSLYGGFGKILKNTSAKGTCVVYVVSDRGTNWNENLCLYAPNPDGGDVEGMYLGLVVAAMLISAMALVVLVPKKIYKK